MVIIKLKQLLVWAILIVTLDFVAGYFLIPQKTKQIATVKNLNSYYQHGFNAGTTGVNYYGHMQYPIAVNSMGMVDAAPRKVEPKNPLKHRLLLLGDSFVEGVGYPYKQTFAGLLQQQTAAHNIEILNAGVASFSPRLYYLRLKYLLEQEQLKVNEVFCFIDYSDIGDELVYEDFEPESYSAIENYETQVKQFFRKNSLATYLYYTIKLKSFVSKNKDNIQAEGAFWQKTNNEFLEECPDFFYLRSYWHTLNTNDYCIKKALNNFEKNITLLNNLCKANNIKLTMVIYPYPGHIDDSPEELNAILTPFMQVAQNKQIKLINLYPLFVLNDKEKIRQYQKKYFIPNDGHWNNLGHQFIANHLYQYINKEKSNIH
jgi:lysophospholipase L1-like esterase